MMATNLLFIHPKVFSKGLFASKFTSLQKYSELLLNSQKNSEASTEALNSFLASRVYGFFG